MVAPLKTKSPLHKKNAKKPAPSTTITPSRTQPRNLVSGHTPSLTSRSTPNPLQYVSDKNTKLTRKVRDLLKLKATYNNQIANLKSTNKQLQRELYAKQVEKDKECSLVTDRATKSRKITEKLHEEALTQVVTELEGKDNRVKVMIGLYEKDMVKKAGR